jgi:hypothetical protein
MQIIWTIFVIGALLFFTYAVWDTRKERFYIFPYFILGVFLLIFDFFVETVGGFLNFWVSRESIFPFGFVPLEVMVMAVFGGTAWVTQVRKLKGISQYLYFILFWTTGGAFGEQILLFNGMMEYRTGWNLYLAWIAYLITWIILIAMTKLVEELIEIIDQHFSKQIKMKLKIKI